MLHRLCHEYGVLPSSGGILDQDSYIIYGLQAVSQAVAQLEEKESQKRGSTPRFTGGPVARRR